MKIILSIILSLLFVLPVATQAQEDQNQDNTDFIAGSDIQFKSQEADESKLDEKNNDNKIVSLSNEVTVIEDKYAGQYLSPTVQNLSKLYWKMNSMNIDNDTHIDNFMLVNECDIYQKFYTDDFEWMRVREAGREMLKENKADFSNQLQMIVPIDLGRYDMQRKGFPLINQTAFKELRRIEIGGNSDRSPICKKDGNIPGYPRNMIMILNKPFTYEFLELDEHIAQAFIIRRKYNKVALSEGMRASGFQRPVFARIRFTIKKYQGETTDSNGAARSIMFGELDGIDIFEDKNEKILLLSRDLK